MSFNKYRVFAPLLTAGFVFGCVQTSLNAYEMPSYPVPIIEETEMVIEETETVKQGKFELKDGLYEGEGTGFAGKIRVSVRIKDQSIVSVDIVDSGADDAAFVQRAKGVIDAIIEKQSTEVDAISGATYSSKGIIAAVKNALTGEEDTRAPQGSAFAGTGQGSLSVMHVQEADAYKDGIYYGSGTGFAGPIQVRVIVTNGKIASISIEKTSDGSSYIQSASAVMTRIIAGQTTNVDTVSGATYSSVGIIEAVRNALSQASLKTQETEESKEAESETAEETEELQGKFPYKDGIYYGTGEGFNGEISIGLVLKNNTIKYILVTKTEDDAQFFQRAEKLITDVISKQSLEVDAVTGATYSSNGILEAIKNALKEAEKSTNEESALETESVLETESALETESVLETESTAETEKPEDTVFKDGIYTAKVLCEPDEDEGFEAYNLYVTIEVKKDRIVSVTNIYGDGDPSNERFIQWAVQGRSSDVGVVQQILSSGNLQGIDTVSRATCSSKAILDGCQRALEEGRK